MDYEPLFEGIGRHLGRISVELLILISVIAVAERLLSRRSAVVRHLLWLAVIARLAVPVPVSLPDSATLWLHRSVEQPVTLQPLVEWTSTVTEETAPAASITPEPSLAIEPLPVEPSPSRRPLLSPLAYAGAFWCAVVALLAVIVAIRWLALRRVLRRCIALDRADLRDMVEALSGKLGLRRRVTLYAWDGSVSLAGVIHPRIMLPTVMADTWPREEIEPVLMHELAHVKRADLVVNWLTVILQAVYFFHPLVWYANRRLRVLREEACDDLAVAALDGSRKRYVASMLRVLEEAAPAPAFGFAAMGFAEKRSNLGERIRRIMDARHRIVTRIGFRATLGLGVILLMAGVLAAGTVAAMLPGKANTETVAVSSDTPVISPLLDAILAQTSSVPAKETQKEITITDVRTAFEQAYSSIRTFRGTQRTQRSELEGQEGGTEIHYLYTPGKLLREAYDTVDMTVVILNLYRDGIQTAIYGNGAPSPLVTSYYTGPTPRPDLYPQMALLTYLARLGERGYLSTSITTDTYNETTCYLVTMQGTGKTPPEEPIGNSPIYAFRIVTPISAHYVTGSGFTSSFMEDFTKKSALMKLWVDAKDLLPVAFEQSGEGLIIPLRTTFSYQTIRGYDGRDYRIPLEIRVARFDPLGKPANEIVERYGGNGEIKYPFVEQYPGNWEINYPYPDSLFEITTPPKTDAVNLRNMKTYFLTSVLKLPLAQRIVSETDNFLLDKGSAGYVKIDMNLNDLSNYYDSTGIARFEWEGPTNPMVVIRLGNDNARTPYLVIEPLEDGKTVWRIRVFDDRFKTRKGIGIGSSYGDIKKAYGSEPLRETGHSGGEFYVFVPSVGLHFGLDVTPSAKIHLKDIPDESKVIDVVVNYR